MGENLHRYREYSSVLKFMTIIKSTKLGYNFIVWLKNTFPIIKKLPNNLSWMWNRLRNPDRYLQFADERKWVFIIGCSNSGTSLLHDLLVPHPNIASLPGEGQFYTDVLPLYFENGCSRVWSENLKLFRMTETHRRDNAPRLIHDWKNYLNRLNADVVLEKTPSNTLRSRWLQTIFKNSYFIAIARDGRAVAEGISRRGDGIGIDRAIAHWIKANNLMLDDAKLLNKFLLVRYEDFVADPHGNIMEILRFIEEDPEKYKFDLNRELEIHNINDQPTAITNFNQKSFDRIPKVKFDEITAQIQPTMQRLGYND